MNSDMLFQVLYWDGFFGGWYDLLGVALTAEDLSKALPEIVSEVGAVIVREA